MFMSKIIFINSNILYIILVNDVVNSLLELSEVVDNDIAITESIIRDTVKHLFTTFRISYVSRTSRLRPLLTIHNFFLSITLKDYTSLKEIVKLTRVRNIHRNTRYLILLINEVLNDNEQKHEEIDDIFVNTNIKLFVTKLRDLKMSLDHSGLGTDMKYILRDNVDSPKTELTNTKTSSKAARTEKNDSRKYEYWYPSARRIYRGRRVRIKSFPFMASVQFFDKFQCGGSIIKSDLVITSSSCLQLAWNNRFFRENPAFLSVRVGSDYVARGGEKIPVLEVYFHPEYDPKSLKNNLAIMRLTKRIHFSKKTKKVKKIDFDRNPSPLPDITERITVLGWGARDRTNYVSHGRSNQLALADLDFYPLRECRHVYSKKFVTRKHFCAGFFSKGGGACNHDAGGPGIVEDKLMGIISFGSLSCGAADSPTVFTKLGYYTDWIEEILEQDAPHTNKLYVASPTPTRFRFIMPTLPTTYTFEPLYKSTSTTTADPIDKINILRALKKMHNFKDLISHIFENDNEDDDYNV